MKKTKTKTTNTPDLGRDNIIGVGTFRIYDSKRKADRCYYELRFTDNDIFKPISLENSVWIDFYGTIVTKLPVRIGVDGRRLITAVEARTIINCVNEDCICYHCGNEIFIESTKNIVNTHNLTINRGVINYEDSYVETELEGGKFLSLNCSHCGEVKRDQAL